MRVSKRPDNIWCVHTESILLVSGACCHCAVTSLPNAGGDESIDALVDVLEEAIIDAIAHLGDVPPCVYEGLMKDFGADMAIEAGEVAVAAGIKMAAVTVLKDALRKHIRKTMLDQVTLGRLTKAGVPLTVLITGYTCYGLGEALHEASDDLAATRPELWGKLHNAGKLHVFAGFLEDVLPVLDRRESAGIDQLIKQYCCDANRNG